jgi:hypothetical protein
MRQLWTRAAVIALTAGTLAACESTGGAQYPGPGPGPHAELPDQSRRRRATSSPRPPRRRTRPTSRGPDFSAAAVGVSSQPLAPVATTRLPPPAAAAAEPAPHIAPRAAAPAPVVVTTVGGPVVTSPARPRATRSSPATISTPSPALRHHPRRAGQGQRPEEAVPPKPGQVLKGPEPRRQGLCRPDRRHDVRHRQALLGHGRRPGRGERPEHRLGDQEGPEAAPAGRLQGQGPDQDHGDAGRAPAGFAGAVAERAESDAQPPIGSTPGARAPTYRDRPPSCRRPSGHHHLAQRHRRGGRGRRPAPHLHRQVGRRPRLDRPRPRHHRADLAEDNDSRRRTHPKLGARS